MIIKIYGCCLGPKFANATTLYFEPLQEAQTISIDGGPQVRLNSDLEWNIIVPDKSMREKNEKELLQTVINGKKMLLSAQDVFSLANLNLHGFSFAK